MKLRHLLCILFLSWSISAVQPIRIQLNSLSVRYSYGPENSVTGPNDDLNFVGSTIINGEMGISPQATENFLEFNSTHQGIFEYYDGVLMQSFNFPFSVDLPTTDTNGNGIPDVYEYQGEIGAGNITGRYMNALGKSGTFTTSFWKNRNSSIGNSHIQYDFQNTSSNLSRFVHFFFVYEYTAVFLPGTPSKDGVCTVSLAEFNGPKQATIGGILKYRSEAGKLTILRESMLTNSAGAPFQLTADSKANVRGRNIYGFIQVHDGAVYQDSNYSRVDPNFPDFKEWSLLIEDPNDSNGNGVSDLWEGILSIPPRAPRLDIVRTGERIRLSIHGDVAAKYVLEDAASLPATWMHPINVTLTSDPHTLTLPAPSTSTYWRARLP